MKNFDIIIIGGGHAGIEAAIFNSKKKNKTLLITNSIDNIGSLSCNPSIGGIGKGHLVKEINSIGGIMGYLADNCGIQFKNLNISKGDAVKSIRIQIDRIKYKKLTQKLIKNQNYLYITQESAEKLIIKNNKILGVKTNINNNYYSKSTIITTGTFLNGKIYIGLKSFNGGRWNDITSKYLADQLRDFSFYGGRLKTGTPPRINGKYINFNELKKQNGDINPIPYFSNSNIKNKINQQPCWLTKTNNSTHEIIKKNLKYSPVYNKILNGSGPRYCPSIEDKIYRFYEKNSHQVFLEPEGVKNKEFYPSGLSTSLPYKIQIKIIKSIKGLENTVITRPGYSIEYDFFNPTNLKLSLESKIIEGLFLAGQINGTTGYEEAAAQGVVAGINSHLYINNKEAWYPKNKNSYIGVMINDLIFKGITEPYRIFTSRSDFKLNLREDNSNIRIIRNIKNIKYLNKKKFNLFFYKINLIKKFLLIIKINKNIKYKFNKLKKNFSINIIEENRITYKDIIYKIKMHIKYKNYIELYYKKNKISKSDNNFKLPSNLNYFKILDISKELRENLNKIKPKNISKIKNLLGATKQAINSLKLYINKTIH